VPLSSAARLAALWSRGGWLGFFVLAFVTLMGVYTFASILDAVLAARADLNAVPFALQRSQRSGQAAMGGGWATRSRTRWASVYTALGARLEDWTANRPDAHIAWTLGIAWACTGGGLAGFTLIFAKASSVVSFLSIVALCSRGFSQRRTGVGTARAREC
jgi:hypothetical protein